MENNELFKTIERLKESLEEVESARQQVSETVAAYSGTQKEIGKYVAKLDGIKSALNGLITLLQNHKVVIDQQSSQAVANLSSSCDTIIANANTKLNATADAFATASGESVAKMQVQQKLFDETIDKASSLKNEISALTSSVKSLQSELSSSQKAQDEAISSIDTTAKSISTQLSKSDATINGIVTTLSGQNNSLSQISQALTAVSSTLAQLSISLQNVQTTLVQRVNNAQSQLGQQVTSIANNFNVKQEELKNKVSTLQTLLIVQLVISVIAIISMFFIK